jgi:hypothetical protein
MYGHVSEGLPFQVFARREGNGSDALVFKFECSEGMGILGLRKVGRPDPPPSPAYEEQDIQPESLRAGRFVHVLPSGQRQSYALSRLAAETAARMPADRWVSLEPHTEYGFRYLLAPEAQLESASPTAQVLVGFELPASPSGNASAPASALTGGRAPTPVPLGSASPISAPGRIRAASLPPPSIPPSAIPLQTPMIPALAATALSKLTREQAIDHLKGEMAKVSSLQTYAANLEEQLRRSQARERDLVELLARWQQQGS